MMKFTECAGGSSTPCSSRGECDEGKGGAGTCTCEDGYSGIACEICIGSHCPGEIFFKLNIKYPISVNTVET